MTPVAKWYDFKSSGELLSGNGGIINLRASYKYDENKQAFLPIRANGQPDPAGAFTLEQEGEEMRWSREEEGMQVTVHLKKIEEIPMASWDHIQGAWQIEQVFENEQDVTAEKAPGKVYNLYVRWDHLFTAKNDLEGNAEQWGVWQIHGHKAEWRLIHFDENKTERIWQIKRCDAENLILERSVDGVQHRQIFVRGE